MNNPNGYTVPLALEDFIPVLLGAFGCYFLVKSAASRIPDTWRPGLIGVAFVTIGGASKSTWKLIVASGGSDYAWMQQVLFPLLAIGFCLVGWALWSGLRERVLPNWPLVVVLSLAWIAADALHRMKPFFAVAVLASLIVTAGAITWSVRVKAPIAIIAFVVQLLGVFALVPFQAKPKQTLGLQWAEQSTNTLAQAAFLFGAYMLWTKVRELERIPVA
jgi:hypothetical protein